ncbi:MAG: hypothetical protein JRI68_34705, partial [Deltaproteobacteria bacterium]|nr:hypothetical protein [Deltaproteobacteria bacterium]
MTLDQQLADLPEPLRRRLAQRGFDPQRLAAWGADIFRGQDERNRLKGDVQPVGEDRIVTAPDPSNPRFAELHERGAAAVAAGQLAICVLAGG